ncbi:hypothetical protein ACHAXR_006690 [Thalassiosira sp. AJA248-18]
MKFIALVSGGKDSIYSALQAIENGHELACCAHLAPRQQNLEEESYMYQTAGSEAVRMQVEECIGVPFYVREIHGRSKNTSLVYDTNDDDDKDAVSDEVEDLFLLLQQIQRDHPDVSAVSSGAILSTYQRTRIEHVCARLNLTSLSYLWRMSSQRTVLNAILDDGQIDAVLVRVACPPGLMPYRHLGKYLRELRDRGILDQLKDRWGMHPAGEGGEYETLVLDCPKLFKHGKLVLEETEVVCDESDDGVGILKIIKCSVQKKNSLKDENAKCASEHAGGTTCQSEVTEQVQRAKSALSIVAGEKISLPADIISNHMHQLMHLPNVRMMKGGLCHVSALLSPIACNQQGDEAQAAVVEFLSIRQMLQTIISRLFQGDQPQTSPQDILYVHLYLSQISHFAKINQHYQQFFGTQLPPSRSCVAVGKGALPGGRRVMMDCILQRGSGGYLRSDGNSGGSEECDTFLEKALQNKHHSLRKTLHVQSISHWAPVCIGPYSQANTLRSSLVFLAGMMGLVPQSMTLIQPDTPDVAGWEVQLYQSWKNAAAVLDGLDDGGGKLEDCLGGLVYFSAGALRTLVATNGEDESTDFPWHKLWKTAQCICNDALSANAGVLMGSVDGVAAEKASDNMDPTLYDEDGVLYGGYEDEDTWREMSDTTATPSPKTTPEESYVPLLMVCLPELPANAEAEVELILASRRAASCLTICNSRIMRSTVQCSYGAESTASLGRDILWDTGYDHAIPPSANKKNHTASSCIEISSVSRFVGLGCACASTVMATWKPREGLSSEDVEMFNFNIEDVLSRMLDSSINNAKGKDELSSLFTIGDVLNVRVYYKAAASFSQRKGNVNASTASSSVEIEMLDDGTMLRTHLHSVLQLKSRHFHSSTNIINDDRSANIPAYTVVPVLGMNLSNEKETSMEETGTPLIAMQVTLADMTRMETEMWVRHNRQYKYDN